MAYIIGIDIGTGSTKAVAINTQGTAHFTTQVAYPTLHPQPDYSEQEPELIWLAFTKCIQTTIQELGEQPLAIAISSAMHSIIPVSADGTPLMNMITWADNRSAAIAQRVKESNLGEALYRQTGTPIHSMSPLCKIIWLTENNAALVTNTAKFISIKEFIWHKLFHVYETDYSLASATGLFDIEQLVWSNTALSLAGITPSHLSQPVNTSHLRKDITPAAAAFLTVESSVPFIIGGSDGCMANLGSFAIEPGIAALTIGTSGAIRVGNTTPTYNFGAMTFNYRLDENIIISGGPVNNGGGALKWYIESFLNTTLTSPQDYNTILDKIKNIKAGSEGLVFLPYLLGERAPLWNSDACGVFFGISGQHRQAHFTRAVIEGITFALYDVAHAMEEAELEIKQVHVSGGFVHSAAWVQLLADIFNKKVCLVHSEDASAVGAAYIALKTLGFIHDYKALMPQDIVTYQPDAANHAQYQKGFIRYKKLYENLKPLMV